MRFTPASLPEALIVDVDPFEDERGSFARVFCAREFSIHAPDAAGPVQVNMSFNRRAGTIRGLHFQVAPHEETKLVRCVRGGVFDVVVDIRPGSPTRGHWTGAELTADNRRALIVPRGFAHGYQTLADDTELLYQVSAYYTPGAEKGLRYDDPEIGIRWPLPVSSISAKDLSWPSFSMQAATIA